MGERRRRPTRSDACVWRPLPYRPARELRLCDGLLPVEAGRRSLLCQRARAPHAYSAAPVSQGPQEAVRVVPLRGVQGNRPIAGTYCSLVRPGLSPGCRVAGCCRVRLPGCRGVAGSVPGCRVPGVSRVLPGAAGCCRVLPGCEDVCPLSGAAGCCRVLPGCRVAGLCCRGSCRAVF